MSTGKRKGNCVFLQDHNNYINASEITVYMLYIMF